MKNTDNKCEKCGKELEESQYASKKIEGKSSEKNNLVCRNYPDCEKAEKII